MPGPDGGIMHAEMDLSDARIMLGPESAEGGMRGPDLTDVATRLTDDQLVRQVLQGGGNMPAYGKNLSPDEVTALVAFMHTLRPENEPAARNSAVPATRAARSPGGR